MGAGAGEQPAPGGIKTPSDIPPVDLGVYLHAADKSAPEVRPPASSRHAADGEAARVLLCPRASSSGGGPPAAPGPAPPAAPAPGPPRRRSWRSLAGLGPGPAPPRAKAEADWSGSIPLLPREASSSWLAPGPAPPAAPAPGPSRRRSRPGGPAPPGPRANKQRPVDGPELLQTRRAGSCSSSAAGAGCFGLFRLRSACCCPRLGQRPHPAADAASASAPPAPPAD